MNLTAFLTSLNVGLTLIGILIALTLIAILLAARGQSHRRQQ